MHIHGKLKKIYRNALNYYAEQLFTPQMLRYIEVRVSFRKGLECSGFCIVDDYNVLGQPRTFVIEVKKEDPEDEILQTLAHEMVHVRQYARGELNEGMTVWRGKRVQAEEIPYENHPWEKEANKVGDKIYREFMS